MESTNTKNLRHLYDLTHAVPSAPEVGAAYTLKLVKTFNKRGVTIPTQASRGVKYCSHCSTVLIPGVNMSMRIVYTKNGKNSKEKKKNNKETRSKPWSARKRRLVFTCFCCNKTTEHDVMNPTAPRGKEKEKEYALPKSEAFVATWEPTKMNDNDGNRSNIKNTMKDSSNKAKERAKKRKKNSLSSLLSGKKDAEEKEKQKSSLLSLTDFMKM